MTHHSPDQSRILTRSLAAVAALLTAGGLAACSGSSGGGGGASSAAPSTSAGTASSAPAPVTTTTTATATKTTGAPSNSASGGSAGDPGGGSDGVAVCRESQLRAQIDPRPIGQVPSGDHAVVVQFINTSGSACTIHGYPGAAITDASRHQVVQATRTLRGRFLGLPTSVTTLPTVTLKPGAVAAAGIEGVYRHRAGTTQAGCDYHYPGIIVTPPNTSTAVPFTITWPACYTFTVHPTNIDRTAN